MLGSSSSKTGVGCAGNNHSQGGSTVAGVHGGINTEGAEVLRASGPRGGRRSARSLRFPAVTSGASQYSDVCQHDAVCAFDSRVVL